MSLASGPPIFITQLSLTTKAISFNSTSDGKRLSFTDFPLEVFRGGLPMEGDGEDVQHLLDVEVFVYL